MHDRAELTELIPVRINGGLVVFHTPDQYRALWKGVDREAALNHYKAITGPDDRG